MFSENSTLTEYEISSRVKNMGWTVSGDYTLKVDVDTELYKRSEAVALYEAIKQGAFIKYFDTAKLNDYILKKLFLGGNLESLLMLSSICTDIAVFSPLSKERAGLDMIRRKAFKEYLDLHYSELYEAFPGRLTIGVMQLVLTGKRPYNRDIEAAVMAVMDLEEARTVDEIIEVVDELYNKWEDPQFEVKSGKLSDVLEVTEEELADWDISPDVLKELYETAAGRNSQMVRDVLPRLTQKNGDLGGDGKNIFSDARGSDEKVQNYIRQVFGKSILTKQENEILNRRLCNGTHTDCCIHITDGILNDMPENSAYYKYAEMFKTRNIEVFKQNKTNIRHNVMQLTDILRKALRRRTEPDVERKTSGSLIVRELWKVGRVDEPRIFEHESKRNNTNFVVDLLIDGSGSQSSRQSVVALQSFILSEALSGAGIPFRVTSFCSFWEYTILHVFRDYDDNRDSNFNIFEYRGRANNRDGLAIKTACDSLLRRSEENKLMIILSDGKPNAVSKGTENSKNPVLYQGEYAVKDTALEVRRAREKGISVMGIFTGLEEDLEAEHKIFGNAFAYTKNIDNFSKIAGKYIKMHIESED